MALLLLAAAGTAGAQNKCQSMKIKAAGKKAKCLLNLDAKAAKTGIAADPVKVQKCKDKLVETFMKAEAKPGCLTGGDAQDIEDMVDAFRADVKDALETIPNFCGDATSPQCDGLCGPGRVCVSTLSVCECVDITGACGLQAEAPQCGGSCLETTPFCIDVLGTCQCAVAPPP